MNMLVLYCEGIQNSKTVYMCSSLHGVLLLVNKYHREFEDIIIQ